jgi:hypothetical protein
MVNENSSTVENPESDSLCMQCGGEVQSEDEFCVHCGNVFAEQLHCRTHPQSDAEGVCLICRVPYCAECGATVGTVFLCRGHSTIEVFDHGASVFRSADLGLAEIASQVLTESGYHPFLVSRAIVPVTNLGRLTPNTSVGPHIVIVPFHEFLTAEEELKKQDIVA